MPQHVACMLPLLACDAPHLSRHAACMAGLRSRLSDHPHQSMSAEQRCLRCSADMDLSGLRVEEYYPRSVPAPCAPALPSALSTREQHACACAAPSSIAMLPAACLCCAVQRCAASGPRLCVCMNMNAAVSTCPASPVFGVCVLMPWGGCGSAGRAGVCLNVWCNVACSIAEGPSLGGE